MKNVMECHGNPYLDYLQDPSGIWSAFALMMTNQQSQNSEKHVGLCSWPVRTIEIKNMLQGSERPSFNYVFVELSYK